MRRPALRPTRGALQTGPRQCRWPLPPAHLLPAHHLRARPRNWPPLLTSSAVPGAPRGRARDTPLSAPSRQARPPALLHAATQLFPPQGLAPGQLGARALRRQTLRENRLRGEGPHDRGLGGPTAQGPALWGEQSIQGWRQGPGPAKPKLPPPTRTRGHSAEDAGLQQKRADAEAEPPHVTLCTPSMQGQAYSTETRPPTLMGPRVRLWSPTAGAHAGLPRLRVGANASAEG